MVLQPGQTNPNDEDLLSESQSETTSLKGKDTSSSGKKVTLSLAELQKRLSDARMDAGRKWKKVETERDDYKKQLDSVTSRLDELETDRRNRAFEEARNTGGDALTLFQRNDELAKRERAISAQESNIRKRELQIQEDESSFNNRRAELIIPLTATKYGLKPEDLEDFKSITDEAVLDRIAQRISGKKPEDATPNPEEEGNPFEPISFQSSGAVVKGKITTSDQAEKASMEELAEQLVPKPSK